MIIHCAANATPLLDGFYWYKQLPENLLLICLIIDNTVSIIGDTETIDLPTFLRMEQKKGIEIIDKVRHDFDLKPQTA